MEIWKDIPGFEGLYQASSIGRIKSLARFMKRGKAEFISKERILNQHARQGYFMIGLVGAGGKKKRYTAHRLILSSFIEPSNQTLDVNHINGIKGDNRIENLEWVTRSENHRHAYRLKLKVPKVYRGESDKPCMQISKDGKFIAKYSSIKAAADATRISAKNISTVIIGRTTRAHAGGFKWKLAM